MIANYTISIKPLPSTKDKISIHANSVNFFDMYHTRKYDYQFANYDIHFAKKPNMGQISQLFKHMFEPLYGINDQIFKIKIKTMRGSGRRIKKFGFRRETSQQFLFYLVQDIEILKNKNVTLKKNDIVLNDNLIQIWPEITYKIPEKLLKMHEQQKQK